MSSTKKSESDSPKFSINYVKIKPVNWKTLEETYIQTSEDIEYQYNPFFINKIQNYNPIYSQYFVLNENNYNTISLNHKRHFQNTTTVFDTETKKNIHTDIFIKYSPLLDPYRFMTGKYKNNTESINLPSPIEKNTENHIPKLSDYNNASYVDNFFSFISSKLLEEHGFIHGLDYYGSFLGIQNRFKVNIADDLEFIKSSDYFLQNINKHFILSKDICDNFTNLGSRSNKLKIKIKDEDESTKHNITAISLEEIEIINDDSSIREESTVVYEKKGNNLSNPSTSSSEDDDDDDDDDDDEEDEENDEDQDDELVENEQNDEDKGEHDENNDEEEEEWETEEDDDDDDEEEEEFQYAYIKNFPIQLICLEKCDGTMDDLFVKKEVDQTLSASALFQIIMILITYQKTFHFTHNDLHTNNIMFSNTDKKFIYYQYKKQIYKVPTHGKIFKIIDFGRSIYKFKGQLLCSDSFALGGDASTQYNTEPFLNENKPRLDPNYSFDLCRLGCSIYDFIIDDDEPDSIAQFDELQKTIYRWCTNDDGKNILYKRNGEERYPNFKLYKMIAKTAHKHTPQEQLNFPYFKQFLMKDKKISVDVDVNIDILPCYVH
uniref:Protein kinase domain-containing protein n=1 Tax=viral metagenome TaxID=1070528 RepID=A0A6C0HTG5_9ZZZZ